MSSSYQLTRRSLLASTAAATGALIAPNAFGQGKPIKIGVPMPLSGPAALFGVPAVKGMEMFVAETNAAGGLLGRPLQLLVRDSKATPDEAVRVAREMILKEDVNFLVGTLTSAEGPAVSTIAKENKIVLIAPIPKTDQLTAPKNLHPYIFRTAANTTMEGRSSAEIMAKWTDVKTVATIAHDYAYGQDVAREFATHIKKLRPDINVVDQQWPKLGESDYTPFINAQMAKKPDAVFSAMWGGHFVTWTKQAKPLGFFDLVKYRVVNGGEGGSVEATRGLAGDYPFGIWSNTYDLASYEGMSAAHKAYVERIKAFTKEDPPSTWPITTYVALQFLAAAVNKVKDVDNDKVAKALLDISVDAPFGKQTIRAKDHQADRGQFYGKMVKGPTGTAIMTEVRYVDPKPFMD
ncbi:MAG TPA: ABC transporter substrate-binding protein [Hyphomicrobiaceae bacterium]|nr:ABC transporter substrate-binding protein [Hyphomicrobiaceae bacterium]